MKISIYTFLLLILFQGVKAQVNTQEDIDAENIHQYMLDHNLISTEIDTTTFIKSVPTNTTSKSHGINNNSSKISGIINPPSVMSFDDGDFSNYDFYLGFNNSNGNYNNCFFPNYDPTAIGKPLDIRDKFHVFNSNQPTNSDPMYDTYIYPSVANVILPQYFLRLGNYSVYSNSVPNESQHTISDKWSGPPSCNNSNSSSGNWAEKTSFVISINNFNKYYEYYYAISTSPSHSGFVAPFFSISMFTDAGVEILCAKNFQTLSDGFNAPGFISEGKISYKTWTGNFVDLSNYIGQNITVIIEIASCGAGGHNGTLYFTGKTINNPVITTNSIGCNNFNMNLSGFLDNYANSSLTWDFGDGTPSQTQSGTYVNHTYSSPGTYTVNITYDYTVQYLDPTNFNQQLTQKCSTVFTTQVNANCGTKPCEDW